MRNLKIIIAITLVSSSFSSMAVLLDSSSYSYKEHQIDLEVNTPLDTQNKITIVPKVDAPQNVQEASTVLNVDTPKKTENDIIVPKVDAPQNTQKLSAPNPDVDTPKKTENDIIVPKVNAPQNTQKLSAPDVDTPKKTENDIIVPKVDAPQNAQRASAIPNVDSIKKNKFDFESYIKNLRAAKSKDELDYIISQLDRSKLSEHEKVKLSIVMSDLVISDYGIKRQDGEDYSQKQEVIYLQETLNPWK